MRAAARLIKEIRLSTGLNQSQFARKLGISRNAVCNYEQGSRMPRFDIFKQIKEIAKQNGIEVSLEDFFS